MINVPSFRQRLASTLTVVTDAIERRAYLAPTSLAVLFILAALAQSHARPLSHDELFTFYIAQAPSLAEMFYEIRPLDLNPPLGYLLTRLLFHILPGNALSCRLPEILAFAVALFCTYSLVKRRAGVLFGSLAAALLFSSLAGEIATNARPYALLLAFTSLSLLGWQKAREPGAARLVVSLGMLLVGALGLLLSHIFGLLSWAAISIGIAFAPRSRDRFPWKPMLAWTLPLLTLKTYLPLLRSHGVSAFPVAFQPTGEDIFTFYISHIDRELVTLGLTSLALLLILGRVRRAQTDHTASVTLSQSEWVAIGGLIAIPGVLISLMMRSHGAFFPRYGIVACLGIAILAACLLHRWTRADPRAALLGSIIALLISGQIASAVDGTRLLLNKQEIAHGFEPSVQPSQAFTRTAAIDPRLPLVAASGLTFLEMDRRESPTDVRRLFYLTDPLASLQYAHATIFERMELEKRLFHLRANVAPYSIFLQQHRHFFVLGQYDYPEDWLLRKLTADGATLKVLGRVPGDYKDHELYEVIF